ncbi:MAG TPA: CDP-glucose 4,6-dehydratase [Solirubrobacteraceae bacterium]
MTLDASRSAASDGAVQGAVDGDFWRARRVLLTGHTGFKGAWLALWLQSLGAQLTGFSLEGSPTRPSLYELARVGEGMESLAGDVRDFPALATALERSRAEVVVHMAAQSLVRRSYLEPRETYEVNVMGTVNLLDAVRRHGSEVRAVVIVTSDKCYENREWEWAYREGEPLGGHDPYSNSKGCAELVTAAYRRSFFCTDDGPQIASARAGNVLGGGDWGEDRLVADLMRGAMAGAAVHVRNPHAVRPWQHVLNPLSGYLSLAQALGGPPRASGRSPREYARAWNFGPLEEDALSVGALAQRLAALWPTGLELVMDAPADHSAPHEARYLKLDSSLARAHLGWRPRWDLEEGLRETAAWYHALADGEDMKALTLSQIDAFQRAGVMV